MFFTRDAKRPRLGEGLDASSSSSDDEEEEAPLTFESHPHVDQVPLLLVLGHWPDRFSEMRVQLSDALGSARASEVMNVIEYVAPAPFEGKATYEAFLCNAELGLAYLVLFSHARQHYEAHFNRRWTRTTPSVCLMHVAHAEPRVCMSNSSGITSVPVQYASAHGMDFLDLGVGTASYLANVPAGVRAGGFELNANPLLMQQVLSNMLQHCPTFCFVPLSFSSPWCVLPANRSYVLFSWRPGSDTMPTVPSNARTVCFLKGVSFSNVHEQGFVMQDSHRSVAFYSNFENAVAPQWSSTEPAHPSRDLLHAISRFDLVASTGGDARKLRAAAKSLGLASGCGAERLREHVMAMPAAAYAEWLINKWRWKLVREYILQRCDMSTRMLLSCGVPQAECRARLLQHVRQSRG